MSDVLGIPPETEEGEWDRLVAEEMSHAMDKGLREQFVRDMPAGRTTVAAMSIVTGRHEDVRKDVEKGRLRARDAWRIYRQALYYQVVAEVVAAREMERYDIEDDLPAAPGSMVGKRVDRGAG